MLLPKNKTSLDKKGKANEVGYTSSICMEEGIMGRQW